MSPREQVEALAYRRAGIAVSLLLSGIRRGASLLDPGSTPLCPDRRTAERCAQAELAGHASEQRRAPGQTGWPVEAAREARRLLRPFVSNELELQGFVSRVRLRARQQIEEPVTWRKVQAVAAELLEQTRLSAADITDICIRVEESLQ
jgi:hypothetical protein